MAACVAVLVVASVLFGVAQVRPRESPDLPASGPFPADPPPYEATSASVDPSPIWVDTSPPDRTPREATVALVLDGRGTPVAEFRSQDTVFLIDGSGSMRQNDPSNLRLAAAKHYVDLLNATDRAAVVSFNQNAVLVGGDHLSSDFARVKGNINSIGSSGFTNLFDPIRIATDELASFGDKTHTWVEILLTDGEDTTGNNDSQILSQARRAADRGITIFTVGLIGTGRVDEELLKEIANVTGGKYLRAEDPDALEGIYEEISRLVRYPDIAGRDNTVDAVLPSYVHYVPGSAVPAPDYVGTSGGRTLLQWNFSALKINETWTATFGVTSSLAGSDLYVIAYPDSQVAYTQYDDERVTASFPETFIDVISNQPPIVDAGPDRSTEEASALGLSFSFTDLGSGFTASVDWGYGPPEGAAVVEIPGGPGIPTHGFVNVSHVYGDDGVFPVTATVCDGDGGCGNDSMIVTVGTVAPTVADVGAYVVADLTLRVAGEKWHDVRMDLVWNAGVTGAAHVVRMPGSPDRQTGTITGGRLQLLGSFAIVVYYTPADDPVNGQANGANPVWVVLTMPDGSEVRLQHTFNVHHPSTWTWTIGDLRPHLVGQPITFDATASDVGSDDLTFTWSWGDGTPNLATTYYNNGVSPDPFPSPEVNPITANDVHMHAFAAAGTYAVTLAVVDDDGGVVSIILSLAVG